jgi:hypothetical protein
LTALVASLHHHCGRSAKRAGEGLRFGAVGQEQDAGILGFADRPQRRGAGAPLQLKGI